MFRTKHPQWDIGYNSDSRAKEICELLKIPHNTQIKKNDKISKIYKELDLTELNNSYPSLYKNFSDFIFENTGVKIHQNNSFIDNIQENIELNLHKTEIKISKIEKLIAKNKILTKIL